MSAEMIAHGAELLDLSPADYHKDPCEVPSLSQSIAHTLITKTPLHAWSEHPRLGNQKKKPSKPMTTGQILHKMVLGKGAKLEVIEADNYRTKLAQEIRDRALQEHRLPILASEHADLLAALERIQANIRAYGIDLSGSSEVQIKWSEPGLNGPVQCRGMLDHVIFERGTIYDVKKIRSAHPAAVGRSIINYSYQIQWAAYTSALGALLTEFQGAVDFVFVFIEVEPPFAVYAARPNGMLRELGAMQWRRAVETWEQCLATDTWPGYANKIGVIEAPPWAITDEMLSGED
jgi:hypothetical protein